MGIAKTQSEQILEKIIKDMLISGTNPTIEEIEQAFDELTEDEVLGEPFFEADDFVVARKEQSSALKFNNQNTTIHGDLVTAYKTMLEITDKSVLGFTRWNAKTEGLESRLIDLENRIDNLLLIAHDTSGYFDAVGDHFTNTLNVDLTLSDGIKVDLENDEVKLSDSSSGATSRVFLNLISSDVTFNLVTGIGQGFHSQVVNTSPHYAFTDQERFWKTNAYLPTGTSAVTAELTVRLGDAKTFTRLAFHLHASQNNSATTVTPMYSSDGINYFEIPSVQTSRSITSYGEFTFSPITATHLKIYFEKLGHDVVVDNYYLYEFGAQEISLFNASYSSDPDEVGTLISKEFSILDEQEALREFTKASLEVCEEKPESTSIRYFVAAGSAPGFTPDWKPISPLNTSDTNYASVVDFATVPSYEWTTTTSYNRLGTIDADTGVNTINPSIEYEIIQRNGSTDEVELVTATSDSRRYIFTNSNQRILGLQVHTDINLPQTEINIWRNVGTKGQALDQFVRGIHKGWEYVEPFYETTVLINNTDGISIDVGEKPIYIDYIAYTGVVSSQVLTQGIHRVRVHKDNWKLVTPSLNTLSALQAADPLYPFNHKLLIEGYGYGTSWPETLAKVYAGVDRFAGYLCKEVSLFDFLHVNPASDLTRFTVDKDIPGVSELEDTTDAPLSWVFVVNVDESKGDFSEEQFLLELKLRDTEYKYLRFKAELQTEDAEVTPVLDAYRIKLG